MVRDAFEYLLSLALMVFCSCQTISKKQWNPDDIVISDQAIRTFPKRLSSQEEAQDIDFLIYILSNGYGGRSYTPQNSWVKAISSLKKITATCSIEQFHEQIDAALFLIPDNHLRAYYKGNVSRERQNEEKAAQVGANAISDPKKVWETRMDQIDQTKILYISITEFPDSIAEQWSGFIPSIRFHLQHADNIVIDLRGNGGGDDAKGMELAQVLFGHPFEHPIKKQYRSQTPESLALAINRLKLEMIKMKSDGKKISEGIKSNLKNAEQEYQTALAGQMPTEFIRTDKGGGDRAQPITGYRKPIYILMDRACSSSCEFTIAAFQWHNKVTRVGENTSGTFHFSNAGIAILPHSKIRVSIPTIYSEYYDHRLVERVGFTPDVPVPAGQDAYELTKQLIRKTKLH